jgi:hypothetical protein
LGAALDPKDAATLVVPVRATLGVSAVKIGKGKLRGKFGALDRHKPAAVWPSQENYV